MNGWLLSIVGVVALGVLLEILLSDGQTSKYIKGVFSLAVVLVLVAPLPKFLNKNFDINDFFGESMTTQTTFLNNLNERKNSEREERLLKELKKSIPEVERVRIFYLQNNMDNIDVVKVYSKNINKKEEIIKLVCYSLNLKEDNVKVYKQDGK